MVRVATAEPRGPSDADRGTVASTTPAPPGDSDPPSAELDEWLAGLHSPALAGGVGCCLALLVGVACEAALALPALTTAAVALGAAGFVGPRLAAITFPPQHSLLIPSSARTASYAVALLGALALAGLRATECLHAMLLRPHEATAAALGAFVLGTMLFVHHWAFRRGLVEAQLHVDARAGLRRWWAFALAPAALVGSLVAVDRLALEPLWREARWADRFVAASAETRAAMLRDLPQGARRAAFADAVAAHLRDCATVPDEALVALAPRSPNEVDGDATRFEDAVAARFFTPAWPTEERDQAPGATPLSEEARVGRVFDAISAMAARSHVRRWARAHRRCDAAAAEAQGQALAWFDAVACTDGRADALARYARWSDRWLRRDADGLLASRGSVRACAIESALRGRGSSRPPVRSIGGVEADAASFGDLASREVGARCEPHVSGRLLHLWRPGEAGRPARWQGAIGRSRRNANARTRTPALELVELWRRGDALGAEAGAERAEVVSSVAGCAVPAGLRVVHRSPRVLSSEDCHD